MKELWKNIPNTYNLYQASSLGNIRREGRILKQGYNHKGYPRVYLSIKGKKVTVFTHKLVLLAFVGVAPIGYETLHKNSIKTDNNKNNLRWGTRSENIKQTYAEGRISWFKKHPILARRMWRKRKIRTGEECSNSILSREKVKEIRRMYTTGLYTQKELGYMFGVSPVAIHDVIVYKTWILPGARRER